MDTKMTTVIVNATKQGLTMKVGNRHCYARLTSVKQGAEYRVQFDVNWAYQEFLLQDKHDSAHQLFLNSDECCDYERITVVESSSGKLDMQTQLRNLFGSLEPCTDILEEEQESSAAAPDQKLIYYYSHMMRRYKAWLCKFL